MSTLTIGHEILICDEPVMVSVGRWLVWLGLICVCIGILICLMDDKLDTRRPHQASCQARGVRLPCNHEGHQLF